MMINKHGSPGAVVGVVVFTGNGGCDVSDIKVCSGGISCIE